MAYQTVNPATGEIVKKYATQSDEEVSALLDVAHKRYQSWRHQPAADRTQLVSRAASILRQNKEEYARLLTLEVGKVLSQAYFEVDLSADILDYYGNNAEAFLRPQELPGAEGCTVVTEPLGVLLAIEPWNFPFYQIARVAGPQIAAGNVLMLKQAENVPQSALAFARLFDEAGAPDGVYTNLFCTHDQVAALIADFRVRGVTLTGSERAGAIIGERAGRSLKKVVLELGGSDPAIVFEDAPLEDAINQCAVGRLINTGQACASIKRIIVVGQERGAQALNLLVGHYAKLTVGDPLDPETQIGPVVSQAALDGLLSQIEGARQAGARIVYGGKKVERPGFYLEPTIISDIDEDNPFFQQEAFGPVASVYIVDSEEEAIRLANATQFGLGSSIFTRDMYRAQAVAQQLEAGMVFINSALYSAPEVPFGGVKNSGFGRELSELGIGEFVNRKLIRVASR